MVRAAAALVLPEILDVRQQVVFFTVFAVVFIDEVEHLIVGVVVLAGCLVLFVFFVLVLFVLFVLVVFVLLKQKE